LWDDIAASVSFGPFYAAPHREAAATEQQSAWLSDLQSRINRFSTLPPNWDSYGSKPISHGAIDRALKIASLLNEIVVRGRATLSEKPFAAPISSGGILFEICNGRREIHVEIGPAGAETYEIYRSEAQDEREERVDDIGLREVLSWIVKVG
jgi:hypothetical protein